MSKVYTNRLVLFHLSEKTVFFVRVFISSFSSFWQTYATVINIGDRMWGLHMSLISLHVIIEKKVGFWVIRCLKSVQSYFIYQKMLS